jgi:hypothetical protein
MHRVVALMDDADEVTQAVDELEAAGFRRSETYVLHGKPGAEHLDVFGRRHGLRGMLQRRSEEVFGDESLVYPRAGEHLETGGFMIFVPAGKKSKDTAAGILIEHGAHDVHYYARWHLETLYPPRTP